MPKSGGARPGAGRPVNPNSLRQAGVSGKGLDGWITLPDIVTQPVPDWPLPPLPPPKNKEGDELEDSETMSRQDEREREVWAELWTKPQASQWHAQHLAYDVAIYVRLMVASETNIDTKTLSEARHRAGNLGLTPQGMAALKWRFAAGEVEPEVKAQPKRRTGTVTSIRDRMRVIEGGS